MRHLRDMRLKLALCVASVLTTFVFMTIKGFRLSTSDFSFVAVLLSVVLFVVSTDHGVWGQFRDQLGSQLGIQIKALLGGRFVEVASSLISSMFCKFDSIKASFKASFKESFENAFDIIHQTILPDLDMLIRDIESSGEEEDAKKESAAKEDGSSEKEEGSSEDAEKEILEEKLVEIVKDRYPEMTDEEFTKMAIEYKRILAMLCQIEGRSPHAHKFILEHLRVGEPVYEKIDDDSDAESADAEASADADKRTKMTKMNRVLTRMRDEKLQQSGEDDM